MEDLAKERFVLAAGPTEAQRTFLQLRDQLAGALPLGVEVEHIGSTAVAGCLTKGDLDISVVVDPEDFAAAERALSSLFERNLGSVRTDSFAAFEAPGMQPPVGIQLVIRGAPLDMFVLFRDRLRADPGLIEEDNSLKRRFDGAEMTNYRAAKSKFIESVLEMGPNDESTP